MENQVPFPSLETKGSSFLRYSAPLPFPKGTKQPALLSSQRELVQSLKSHVTILIVTHNMQQAQRISDKTAFMCTGDLVEFDKTKTVFQSPAQSLTREYVSGQFG